MSDPVILCKMEVVYMPIFRLPQTTFKPTKVCIPLSHHNHHHHGHGHSNLTDDDVSVKICSDVNIADCCSATLDKGVRKDEWVKSKTENWEAREFKECKTKPFQVI